jgi:hypothetical protein
MIHLHKLNAQDAAELRRRLGRRWRYAPNDPAARRTYRVMCRVYIYLSNLELAARAL